MAKLKELLLTQYADLVASRVRWAEPDDTHGRGIPGEAPDEQQEENDILRLHAILEEREQLIGRLRATDDQRETLHMRLKERWRGKQAEVAKMRQQLRVLRGLLRSRRHQIRHLLETNKNFEEFARDCHTHPGLMPPPMDASQPPPGGLSDSLARWLLSWIPLLTRLQWRYWMRLGVLRQYTARPLRPDRIPAPRIKTGTLPKISIVTPSFNQVRYLDETMRSVIEQEYPQLEYIVMDGGSTDGSTDVIRKHEADLKSWQSAPDGGQADAVSQGLKQATGDIMAWLNSDDLLMPGSLRLVADYFARHPDVDVVYGHRIIVNENSYEVGRWVLPAHDDELLLWADFVPQETMFWRRKIYEKAGGVDPAFQFALDWDLLLRFQKAGARMVRLPWFMGAFRIHPQQKNAVTLMHHGYQEMKLLRDRELGDEFNSGRLSKRVNRAQFKAMLLTWLMRFGIRW